MARTIEVEPDRRTQDISLWVLQWALGALFVVVGLLKASILPGVLGEVLHLGIGASPGVLSGVGWLELTSGVLLVVPAASRFFPWLTPAAAGLLFATEAVSLGFHGLAVGFGSPGRDVTAAVACLAVAIGRSVLVPVPPTGLENHVALGSAEGVVDPRQRSMRSIRPATLPLLAANHPSVP